MLEHCIEIRDRIVHTRPRQPTKVLIYICHAFKINLGRIRSESTSESYLLHADWKLNRDARVQDAHVSARKCTRAELTRYFTITAKSIKANRNSGVHGVRIYTCTRKSAQTEIRETTRSSCGVIRSSRRPLAVS